MSKLKAITNMPRMEIRSGDSLGRINQLIHAPKIGIMNFHVFKFETLTPLRPNRPNQMVIAMAETMANQPNAK